MLILSSVAGAAHTLCDVSVQSVRHVEPIIFLSKFTLHTSLTGMCGNRRMTYEVNDASTDYSWYHSFGSSINCRCADYDSPVVDSEF